MRPPSGRDQHARRQPKEGAFRRRWPMDATNLPEPIQGVVRGEFFRRGHEPPPVRSTLSAPTPVRLMTRPPQRNRDPYAQQPLFHLKSKDAWPSNTSAGPQLGRVRRSDLLEKSALSSNGSTLHSLDSWHRVPHTLADSGIVGQRVRNRPAMRRLVRALRERAGNRIRKPAYSTT